MTRAEAKAAWIEAHNWTCAHDGEGLEAAERAFETWWTTQQELGRQERQAKKAAKEARSKALVAECRRRSQIDRG